MHSKNENYNYYFGPLVFCKEPINSVNGKKHAFI